MFKSNHQLDLTIEFSFFLLFGYNNEKQVSIELHGFSLKGMK